MAQRSILYSQIRPKPGGVRHPPSAKRRLTVVPPLASSSKRRAHGIGGRFYKRDDLGIVHPGRSDDADGPRHPPLVGVGRGHDAEMATDEVAGLGAHEDL